MCSLFGLLDFEGRLTPAQRLQIFRALGNAAEVRGTDASGVAYVQNGALQIQKAPRPAHKMRWHIAPEARYLMGHTRMTTQGAASKNYNNHPFQGKSGKVSFALAHNGVLYNDFELQRYYRLPHTKIETDSYTAVQLLERQRTLSEQSLKAMAEDLEGSFTITVLDTQSNLYFIKGNNPLTIWLFPNLGVYLYASTEEILEAALDKLGLSDEFKADIPIWQGDIMRIDSRGKRTVSRFDDAKLHIQNYYYGYGGLYGWHPPAKSYEADAYLNEVISYGLSRGVPESELRLLVDAGFDALDLEELLYDPIMRETCVQEILCDYGVC